MNPQQSGPNDRGIEWTAVFGYASGYTWNPIAGCLHGCRWRMSDNAVAVCYAEEAAERFRTATAYPRGFASHYWHPDRLESPLAIRKRAGIFCGSMADVFGHWVPAEQIQAVLDVCKRTPQHIYFFLTKNAPRLREFEFPANCWIGISTPPTFMMGKELSPAQRSKMLTVGLDILSEVKASVRWLSAEPLTFDVAPLVADANLQWVVIGAASNGQRMIQPRHGDVQNLLDGCDLRGIPTFFKGNLRWSERREEWPVVRGVHAAPVAVQASLFGEDV